MPRRTDKNQQEIIDGLRNVGATVFSTHEVGKGFPDLVVGFRGTTYLLEVKTERGKLEDSQVQFLHEWRGQAAVVRTIADALAVLELV